MWLLWACVPEQLILSFEDVHNFEFSSEIASVPIEMLAQEDLTIDWSGLQKDILGTPIDPTRDIHKLSLLLFSQLDHEEVLLGVSNENLRQSDLSGYVEYFPQEGETSVLSSAFSMQGTQLDPIEHLPPDAGSFLLLASDHDEKSLMLSFFTTHVQEGERNFPLHDQSATLSYEVDLHSAPALEIQKADRYIIDWAQITESGTGTPIQGGQIDSLLLAGFSSTTHGELEEGFLSLPSLAVEYYTWSTGFETAIDLSVLSEQGFLGLHTQEKWLLGLQCSRCLNPAPLFVGKIE